MKKGVFLSLLGVLAVMSLAIVGCGDGDDETTASLTRAEFVSQANAVCVRGTKERSAKFREAAKEAKPGQTFSDADREQVVRDVLIPPYRKVIEDLKKLGAPEGDEQEVEAIVEAMEEAADKVEADPGPAVQSTVQFTEANKLSAEYGLTDCVV